MNDENVESVVTGEKIERGTDAYEKALELKIMNEGINAEIINISLLDYWRGVLIHRTQLLGYIAGGPTDVECKVLSGNSDYEREKMNIQRKLENNEEIFVLGCRRGMMFAPKLYCEVDIPGTQNHFVIVDSYKNPKISAALVEYCQTLGVDSITDIDYENSIPIQYKLSDDKEKINMTIQNKNKTEASVEKVKSLPEGIESSDFCNDIDVYITAFTSDEKYFNCKIMESYLDTENNKAQLVVSVPGGKSVFEFDDVDSSDSTFWEIVEKGGNGDVADVDGSWVTVSLLSDNLMEQEGQRKVSEKDESVITCSKEIWAMDVRTTRNKKKEIKKKNIIGRNSKSENGLIAKIRNLIL